VMKKFKLLWKNDIEDSLKISTATGSKTCSALVMYHVRGALHGKIRSGNKVQSELFLVFCFISIPCLG
jgi:hypothetical protein